jgi:MFS family permease
MPGNTELLPTGTATSDGETKRPSGLSSEQIAVFCCVFTVFVDVMGQYFSSPVIIPYAATLTDSLSSQSLVISLPFLGRLVGGVIMPVLSDKTSRKAIIWLSSIGSFIAYSLSAAAMYYGFPLLVAGRLVGGLFGQTMSLLIAYLAELTIPDMALLKQRNTLLMGVNMGAPMILAPIGGLCAGFGLNTPFLVAALVALLGLAVNVVFFQDVKEIREAQAKEKDSKSQQHMDQARYKSKKSSSPWVEPVFLQMSASYFLFGMGMGSSYVLLANLLTHEESFGLAGGEAVAQAIGLTQIPYGVATLLMQTVGYLKLSQVGVSEVACIAAGGTLMACSYVGFFFSSLLWHIHVLYFCNGLGVGLFFGAYMNMPNAFIAKFYPHAIAQARGVPFPFLNVGLMLGPLLLPLLGADSHHVGWAVGGGLQFMATLNLLVVAAKIGRATKWQPGELSTKLRGGAKQALALVKLQEMQRAHNLDAWDEKGVPCPREAKALPAIAYVGNCG